MADTGGSQESEVSLDPSNWQEFRALAHRALDDAIDLLETVRERPVWQPVPGVVREALQSGLPREGQGLERTYADFQEQILPYPTGNIHPRFFGWVHGTGTAGGIVADLLASAMNSNCGGRDHGALYVERAVIDWCKELFGFPETASGVLVSGTSMATLIALTAARHAKAGYDVRRDGIQAPGKLTAYASAETHESTAKALQILGLGERALRRVATAAGSMEVDVAALRAAIAEDRAAGLQPFCVIGTAGTVNTGAIDDLAALADLCAEENLWFHVDGAFGGLCVLSPELRPRLSGIERADSIAFDFHKWMHVSYDAGCVLVRSSEAHQQAFSMRPAYLAAADRGLAGGNPWFCEYGPELSRGFRALKIWFALKEHGAGRFGRQIEQNCRQARYLADRIRREKRLELLVEPTLNIVCFRFLAEGAPPEHLDQLNLEIVATLQEQGIAAPSTTRVGGRVAIRVNLTNHRVRQEDLDILVDGVLAAGMKHVSLAAKAG